MSGPVVALVPMRHDSERVEGKNFRPFAGRPLFHYVVEALLACADVDEIVIDTDSPVILEGAAEAFPSVRVIERPVHLRSGDTSMNDVLLNTTADIEAEFFLQTHSTNPLIQPETISRAIRRLRDSYPEHDSLFGATRWQTRFWDQHGRPVNHDPAVLLRTQDLPPIYEENSNMYIFKRDQLVSSGNRIGDRPLIFEIDRLEAWDIDEEADFRIAEMLYLHREGHHGELDPEAGRG